MRHSAAQRTLWAIIICIRLRDAHCSHLMPEHGPKTCTGRVPWSLAMSITESPSYNGYSFLTLEQLCPSTRLGAAPNDMRNRQFLPSINWSRVTHKKRRMQATPKSPLTLRMPGGQKRPKEIRNVSIFIKRIFAFVPNVFYSRETSICNRGEVVHI